MAHYSYNWMEYHYPVLLEDIEADVENGVAVEAIGQKVWQHTQDKKAARHSEHAARWLVGE